MMDGGALERMSGNSEARAERAAHDTFISVVPAPASPSDGSKNLCSASILKEIVFTNSKNKS